MNEVQILIQYHSEDESSHSENMEMSADQLRALTRELSKIRISDTELTAVVAVKNLHDICYSTCKWIRNFGNRL